VIPLHVLEQLDDVRSHVRVGVQHHLGKLVWLE